MRLKPIQNDECVESVKTCNSSSSGEAWLRLADSKKEKRKKECIVCAAATSRFVFDHRRCGPASRRSYGFTVVVVDTLALSNLRQSVLCLDGYNHEIASCCWVDYIIVVIFGDGF